MCPGGGGAKGNRRGALLAGVLRTGTPFSCPAFYHVCTRGGLGRGMDDHELSIVASRSASQLSDGGLSRGRACTVVGSIMSKLLNVITPHFQWNLITAS